MENKKVEIKRIYIYLAISFGIAWITGLVIYLTGGLVNSPKLTGNISLAFVLLATTYMGAPALANLLTRITTEEGWQNAFLRPKFKKSWLYWVMAWVGPGILTIFGAVIFFLIFPQFYDSTFTVLREMISSSAVAAGQPLPEINPWIIVIAQTIQAILIAPAINAIPTLGEEFGWRAYLQPKLVSLMDNRKAVLLTGVIWGVWHWPAILMGHNYGLEYPGVPWLGPLAMVWFCIVLGTFIGWVSLKGGSVWPAVIAHAAINGIAGIGALLVKGDVNPILGPMPVGVIGSIGFSIVAMIIMMSSKGLEMPVSVVEDAAGVSSSE
jgi:CAAX protease family protein